MKISGLTFIRNAVKYDYPVVEAIKSILPLCDEVVVMLGNSDDDTTALIDSIRSEKIKIFDSVWDDSLRKGGEVLAAETNKALENISPDSDWAFYIQGDEVFHENGIPAVKAAMKQHLNNIEVEGLLFNYRHFYGSYDFIGDNRRWYRKEIRMIRNDRSIRSYRDAQGFRKNGRKLKVKPVDAFIHHYGWVKPPESMQAKQESFHKLWHSDQWVNENIASSDEFDYSQIDSLSRFDGTHPQVMEERIRKKNWSFNFDPTHKKLTLIKQFLFFIEKVTGWRPGEYKNYKVD